MQKAAVILLFATMLGLPATGRAGVMDIRGGGVIVRTWSVGFWETGIGSFDTLQIEWVSGQVLSPPYIMNVDVDGSYGAPFAPDGWGLLYGSPNGAMIGCPEPGDWLGFDLEFLAPDGPTCWQVRVYDGPLLKEAMLLDFDGTRWRFETIGACCIPDGTCAVTTEQDCANRFGAWLGAAAPCSETRCQQTPANGTSWGRVRSLYR